MPILSLNDYIASQRQDMLLIKTQTATSVAAQPHTLWDRAGNPGAGTLAIGNTTTGVVPTDATTGARAINDFPASGIGYITQIEWSWSVAGRLYLYDRLFHVGSINLNSLATTTLSLQPSYASRVTMYNAATGASAADYSGLRIFVEINAAVSATATTVQVTYTNQAGTTGRTTNATASLSGFVTGRLVELVLQAGDTGVQKIESVIVGGVVATSGTVNVFVARVLWSDRSIIANWGSVKGMTDIGLTQVFQDSCLALYAVPDSTSTGTPEVRIEIASK